MWFPAAVRTEMRFKRDHHALWNRNMFTARWHVARIGAALIASIAAAIIAPSCAQTLAPARSGIVAPGNAVVSGFSGALPPTQIQPGTNPADQTVIDLDGPALRVIDVSSPGAGPVAQVIAAPKPFTATAAKIGQVFGVALDNATPPNIYAAATSAYGLPIVAAGPGGASTRLHEGVAGATFMDGLFGPAAQRGGPGSIWRIDGATGAVTLFANVTLEGTANGGPALGGLAFDASSGSLLVADRATGMIHRFDLGGRELGRYDHGTQGHAAAGLAPVAFDPARRVAITSPQFNADDPATWGLAVPERRVFGLAVHGGRLYYAIAQGLQIWSGALTADGFGSDARIEIAVPPAAGPSESPRSPSTTAAPCCWPSARRRPAPSTSPRSRSPASLACCATCRCRTDSGRARRRNMPSALPTTCATPMAALRWVTTMTQAAGSTARPAAASSGSRASSCKALPMRRSPGSSPPAARSCSMACRATRSTRCGPRTCRRCRAISPRMAMGATIRPRAVISAISRFCASAARPRPARARRAGSRRRPTFRRSSRSRHLRRHASPAQHSSAVPSGP